jgi:PST family polysaccharide transporter
MSLKQQTVSGVAWSALGRIGQQTAQFGISVLLARLLAPEQFGLIGMLMVFIGFASLFAEFGFAAALVQRPSITREQIDSVFWLNCGLGLLLSIMFALAAPAIAGFFRTPDLTLLGRVLALSFTLNAVGVVPGALLQRSMDFKSLARIEISVSVISGFVGVALAIGGFGVWSLVAQSLSASVLRAGLLSLAVAWWPRFAFSSDGVGSLLNFSVNLFGFNFINYWARNADNLLVGKLMGSAELGIYTRAYSLMLLPVTQVISVLSRVMFPVMSSIQNDPARVRRVYSRAMGGIALLAFPMMAGLLVVAEPFVLALLGERWAEVVPLLRILCLVGILQTLMNPTGWIYQSMGRTDWLFRWGIGASVVLVSAIGVGVWLGTLESVAWAYLTANAALLIPCLWIPGKLIQLSVSEMLRTVATAFCCAAAMAAGVWVFDLSFVAGWPQGIRLFADVAVGVVVYSVLVLAAHPPGVSDLTGLVLRRSVPAVVIPTNAVGD